MDLALNYSRSSICSSFPWIAPLYHRSLLNIAEFKASTIFWVFGMTRPGIERLVSRGIGSIHYSVFHLYIILSNTYCSNRWIWWGPLRVRLDLEVMAIMRLPTPRMSPEHESRNQMQFSVIYRTLTWMDGLTSLQEMQLAFSILLWQGNQVPWV